MRLRPPFGRVAALAGLAPVALLFTLSCSPGEGSDANGGRARIDAQGPSAGMVWIPGGEFTQGNSASDAKADERPAHRVRLDGFFMDRCEVTNEAFATFVKATHYVTVAERVPTLEEIMKQVPPGTPPPPKESLVAGSMVFTPTPGPVPLDDWSQWWRWEPGADWRHPEGPGSSIAGREQHPVVQVSYEDALAYAAWAGKRLPTEAEWEYAARGGLEQQPFAWGAGDYDAERPQANIYEGVFPVKDTGRDGFIGTAPVGRFKPNGYGLYDMSGNVWEWTSDWYRPDTYAALAKSVARNPQGPESSFDPAQPFSPQRVTRGGSFLCNDTYCAGYRVTARMKEAVDTGMSHLGFRCVRGAGADSSR